AVLFEADMERVYIERLDPSTSWRDRRVPGGEDILVLEGTVEVGDVVCPPLTWLRIPAQHIAPLVTSTGARWWVKRGHLPG
ncbi:cupin domain-containing protein, partial [Erwinia amylovora]|uniref:cupin domain-containing protein n=1 Tax=Erwinia amylovora TaxID=552 RepID=UPI0020BF99BD